MAQEETPEASDVRPTSNPNENNELSLETTVLGPPSVQQNFFHVEKQIEIDGVEMGVLDNGIPYLTESGLARMCGIDRKVLNRLAVNWAEEKVKPRGTLIVQLLEQSNFTDEALFLKSEHNGREINAYTEPVCLAILEFYAFLTEEPRADALRAFRSLARTTFRTFIYDAVGYKPNQDLLESWKHFHDRQDLTMNAVPLGYFGVFQEIASMIVPMIRAGVMVSDKVVPDISVGLAWSAAWEANKLSAQFGDRIKYNHEYPEYYSQAKSNPQSCFAYPDAALGAFRTWLRTHYIANKFPNYILKQAKNLKVPREVADKVLGAFVPKTLEVKGGAK